MARSVEGLGLQYELNSLDEFASRVNALFAHTSHEDFGAHQWLEEFRQTEHVWMVCSQALAASCSEQHDSAVALLSAQLLHAKVLSSWYQLHDEHQAAVVNVHELHHRVVNMCVCALRLAYA